MATTANWIARSADIAVNYVLECVGIRSQDTEEPWHDLVQLQMRVNAACGRPVGVVVEVDHDCITVVANNEDRAKPILIAWEWIERIDEDVSLNREYQEIISND
jgi:hypothetical protein